MSSSLRAGEVMDDPVLIDPGAEGYEVQAHNLCHLGRRGDDRPGGWESVHS